MAPGLTVQMAAQGWGGDRLYGFSVDGETVVVSATVWDTARDALEFEVALASMYKLRWPEATVTTQKGEYGASHCFADGDQIHYIERWGPWVVHIEGLPGGVPFDTVRTAIWETRRVGDYPPTQTRGPGRD